MFNFVVELAIDCDRVPFVTPTIANYDYVIGQSDPFFSIALESTMCGPWIYLPEDASYSKDFAWCSWCVYVNNGLFTYDTVNQLFNIESMLGSVVGEYQISLPVQIPNSDVIIYIDFMVSISHCQVVDLTPSPIDTVVYNVFDPALTVEIAPFG